jgi:CarD family transcriptional regulator
MATAKSAPARKTAEKSSAKTKKAAPAKKSAAKKPSSSAAAKPTAKAKAKAPAAKKPASTAAASKTKAAEKAKKPIAKKVKPAAPEKAAKIVKKTAPAKQAAKPAPIKQAAKQAAKSAPPKAAPAKDVAPKSAPKTAPKTVAKVKAHDHLGYSIKDFVVYPSHGVGQITAIEEHEIGDLTLRVFVVVFAKEKMTLRVPLEKANSSGMRRLSSQQTMEQAISTLKGRARTRRVMWSRRAQEYDAKLNSGDPISIAEVVRDLHRDEGQPDQSYSERQMYEAALERLAREFAAVENTNTEQAAEKLENVLRAA